MNSVRKVLIIEDNPEMQDVLKLLVEHVLGSVPVVCLGLNGKVPETADIVSEIRGGLVLAICDRSLTNGGSEGEEFVKTAAEHGARAVLFSSSIPAETRKKLKELGIPCINKGNHPDLTRWMSEQNS
jgi:hypothetical protein